jgi:hypothetical protein
MEARNVYGLIQVKEIQSAMSEEPSPPYLTHGGKHKHYDLTRAARTTLDEPSYGASPSANSSSPGANAEAPMSHICFLSRDAAAWKKLHPEEEDESRLSNSIFRSAMSALRQFLKKRRSFMGRRRAKR